MLDKDMETTFLALRNKSAFLAEHRDPKKPMINET
jgi:hypothetical protein